VTSIDPPPASPPSPSPPAKAPAESETRVAVTVRMDQATYVRLKSMGARIHKSNQDILLDALPQRFDVYERGDTA
jgi:hypothetical protein